MGWDTLGAGYFYLPALGGTSAFGHEDGRLCVDSIGIHHVKLENSLRSQYKLQILEIYGSHQSLVPSFQL